MLIRECFHGLETLHSMLSPDFVSIPKADW